MQSICRAIKINYVFNERVMLQVLEASVLYQTFKNQFGMSIYLFGTGKMRSHFPYIYGTHLAGPFVQIRKQIPMDGFVVFKIKCIAQRIANPLGISRCSYNTFYCAELFFIFNIELVYKNGSVGIAVSQNGVQTIPHVTPHYPLARLSPQRVPPPILRLS